jgi:hypothetical protein
VEETGMMGDTDATVFIIVDTGLSAFSHRFSAQKADEATETQELAYI